jgi:cobalamin synthase
MSAPATTGYQCERTGGKIIDNMKPGTVALGALLSVFFYAGADMLCLHKDYGTGVITLFLVLLVVFYSFCLLSAKFFKDRFGGLTGDTLGAAGEISEIIYLLVISIWLQHSI